MLHADALGRHLKRLEGIKIADGRVQVQGADRLYKLERSTACSRS
jgi:hypothetical protein